jgi:hypothetical protein
MTKLDLSQFKPIPGFCCLKLKDEIQAKILKETESMTTDEVLTYFRQKSERFDNERKELRRNANQIGGNE